MNSPKNLLQEWFMKQFLPLPVYKTWSDGLHPPSFRSELTINDKRYQSDGKTKKVDAEQDVAQRALRDLKEIVPVLNMTCPVLVLIDGENLSNLTDQIDTLSHSQLKCFEYLSRNHPLMAKPRKNVKKMAVPSTRKDGVDLSMVMDFVLWHKEHPDIRKIIVSRDHFAYTLQELHPAIEVITDFPALLASLQKS